MRRFPFQFSLASLLLVMTLVCLATALVLSHRKIAQLERDIAQTKGELAALQPLSANEVARQFKNRTTLGPVATTVKDVRYSPTDDTYKVKFSWVDPTTKQIWSTDAILTGDGYGAYSGKIRSGPFITALGVKDTFFVYVEAPSSFKQ